jgi:chromosome segregation ATPase
MPNTPSPRPSPAHVLAVYAEPLIRGRRVALIAPRGEALAELLLSLGARLLYVYDPEEPATRKPSDRVTVAPFRGPDLGVRDGAFDLVLLPDLGRVGDAEATLAQVRRLAGPQGVAVIGCRNADAGEGWLSAGLAAPGPSYGEFFDLCALQFTEVRMIGAAPFAGYAVAEFAPEREPAISFDPTLTAAAEPTEWFVAVASQHPVTALDPYEIVQIPRRALAVAEPAAPVTDDGRIAEARAELAGVEHKLHEAEARAGNEHLRAERLANESRAAQEDARKQRERAAKAVKDVEDERLARQKAERELATLAPDANELRTRVLALEAELIQARTQLATPRVPPQDLTKAAHDRDRAQAELTLVAQARDAAFAELQAAQRNADQARRAREELEKRLVERDRAIEAAVVRASALEARLADVESRAGRYDALRAELEQARTRAEQESARAGKAQADAAAAIDAHAREVAELELALRARGEELRAARVELGRRERMVRELVGQLEEAQAGLAQAAFGTARELSAAAAEELDLARRELAVLVDEVRRRDRALTELRGAHEKVAHELDVERARAAELARDAARREAALQTASWRIVELEKLGTESADEATERARLEGELDALKRALAQEHEHRERLERAMAAGSGAEGELARVLARLDEREALIAQLSAELAARSAGGGLG